MNSNTKGQRYVVVWSTRADGEPIQVWPDGCRDLIVCIKPTGKATVILTGLDMKPYCVCVPSDTLFAGVRLVPGTTAKWESTPEASSDKVLYMECIDSFAVSWLQSIVLRPDRAAGYLIEAVEQWFQPGDLIVEDFLATLDDAPGRIPRLGTSERTLRRRVKKATGVSPQFWVALHRVRLAGRAIVFTDDSIADIAFTAGYTDQAHMTREMHRWFGVTPAAMRRSTSSYDDLVAAPDAFTSGHQFYYSDLMKNGLNSDEGSISW